MRTPLPINLKHLSLMIALFFSCFMYVSRGSAINSHDLNARSQQGYNRTQQPSR